MPYSTQAGKIKAQFYRSFIKATERTEKSDDYVQNL